MKRVLIGAGNKVDNVIIPNGVEPAGTYLDVADSVAVGPAYSWNGNTSTPVFTPPAQAATMAQFVFTSPSIASGPNAQVVKNAPANLTSISGLNTTGTTIYLQFYDKATTPVVGTDTPKWTYPLLANAAFSDEFSDRQFVNGLGIAITTDPQGVNTTGATAGAITALTLAYSA